MIILRQNRLEKAKYISKKMVNGKWRYKYYENKTRTNTQGREKVGIAPNGQKSNLTDEQWHQVRSTEFKEWFGDWENNPNKSSKILDKNGEPLIVYHGTDEDFEEYNFSEKGTGGWSRSGSKNAKENEIYLTSSKEHAKGYGENIINLYANIKNPLKISVVDELDEWRKEEFGKKYRNVQEMIDDYYSGEIYEAYDADYNFRKYSDESKETGKDGVIFDFGNLVNSDTGEKIKSIIVAFDPNQIKSSNNNNGEFNPNSNNINKSISNKGRKKMIIVRKSVNLEGLGDNYNLKKLAKKHNVPLEKINKEFAMGIKVELEHTKDPSVASQIAIDHLTESPVYYSQLKKMESKMEKSLTDKQKRQIEKFFTGKTKVKDEDYHNFAMKIGIKPDEAEEYAYYLLLKYAGKREEKSVPKTVYEHPDKPGAGAKKRKKLHSPQDKFEAVMGEFKRGTLRSGNGSVVTNRKQAIAIAASESGMSKAIDNAFWADIIGKRLFTKKESIQAVRDMIVAEYDAIQLYERIAESMVDGSIKEVILDIRDEEKVHIGEFQKLLNVLEPTEDEKYEEGQDEAEDKLNVNVLPKDLLGKSIAALKKFANREPEDDDSYKLEGHRKCHGMDIEIENKKGSIRKGTDPDGHEWETKMNFDYGRIAGAKGSDGESLDAYIGPNPNADMVYVVHQNDPETGAFDENKAMLGFDSVEEAVEGYLSQYDNPDFFGGVSEYPVEEFKEKIKQDSGKMLYKSPILVKSKERPMIIVKSKTVKEDGKSYTTSDKSERRTPPKGYPKDTDKYLDPKQLKYPIDTEKHIRAAMTYFTVNQRKYDAATRKKMWAKLIRAAKKIGIDVSDEVKKRAK